MDNGIYQSSGDYILEKWNAYIGVKPFDIKELSLSELENQLLDEKDLYLTRTLAGVSMRQLVDWSIRWGEESYREVKEILQFLLIINTRPFWTPTELIDKFENWIGKFNEVKNESGPKLHAVIEGEIDKWLNKTLVKRDYKINKLEI